MYAESALLYVLLNYSHLKPAFSLNILSHAYVDSWAIFTVSYYKEGG